MWQTCCIIYRLCKVIVLVQVIDFSYNFVVLSETLLINGPNIKFLAISAHTRGCGRPFVGNFNIQQGFPNIISAILLVTTEKIFKIFYSQLMTSILCLFYWLSFHESLLTTHPSRICIFITYSQIMQQSQSLVPQSQRLF